MSPKTFTGKWLAFFQTDMDITPLGEVDGDSALEALEMAKALPRPEGSAVGVTRAELPDAFVRYARVYSAGTFWINTSAHRKETAQQSFERHRSGRQPDPSDGPGRVQPRYL